jgi:hypothetical protein
MVVRNGEGSHDERKWSHDEGKDLGQNRERYLDHERKWSHNEGKGLVTRGRVS